MVVLTGMTTVVTTVLWAGHRVTVGWQLMMVLVVVEYTVLVVYLGCYKSSQHRVISLQKTLSHEWCTYTPARWWRVGESVLIGRNEGGDGKDRGSRKLHHGDCSLRDSW